MPPNEAPAAPGRPPSETMGMMMLTAAVAAVLGLGVGYYLGRNTATSGPYSPQQQITLHNLGVTEQGPPPANVGSVPPANAPIAPGSASVVSIGGTITAVGTSSITVKAPAPPGAENWIASREVQIGKDTVIVTTKSKDAATLQKETQAFMAAEQNNASAGLTPPQPFEELPTALADLKVGEFVTVNAPNNSDLANQATFLAAKIAINAPAAPPGAPVPPPT